MGEKQGRWDNGARIRLPQVEGKLMGCRGAFVRRTDTRAQGQARPISQAEAGRAATVGRGSEDPEHRQLEQDRGHRDLERTDEATVGG